MYEEKARTSFIPPPPPVVLDPIPAWKWVGAALLLVTCVAALSFFVKWSRAQTHKAEAAVAALHQKMIRADDAGIFADADPSYREMVPADISTGMFENVRTHLGAPRSSIETDSHDSMDETGGSFLTLHYSTVFDKGSGDETICLHSVDGAWRLAAYNVESPLLKATKPLVRATVKSKLYTVPQRVPSANR